MAEQPYILVKIHRRKFTGPTRTSVGVKSLVNTTYSTRQLAPEIVQFYLEEYSLDAERREIRRRIAERLGFPEDLPEITFEGD